jgi:hypothetical protein
MQQIEVLSTQTQEFTSQNSNLSETVVEQAVDIFDNSVRTPRYNCHQMFIFFDPKNNNQYKISVNQVKNVKRYIKYVFPSSFNVKKEIGDALKDKYGKSYHKAKASFPKSDWTSIRELFSKFNPKFIYVNNGNEEKQVHPIE